MYYLISLATYAAYYWPHLLETISVLAFYVDTCVRWKNSGNFSLSLWSETAMRGAWAFVKRDGFCEWRTAREVTIVSLWRLHNVGAQALVW